jgi:hypothetical protein
MIRARRILCSHSEKTELAWLVQGAGESVAGIGMAGSTTDATGSCANKQSEGPSLSTKLQMQQTGRLKRSSQHWRCLPDSASRYDNRLVPDEL